MKRARANPTPEEFAAILNDFAMRGCPNKCKCMLCREFDLGYQAGREDGVKVMAEAIRKLIGEVTRGKA